VTCTSSGKLNKNLVKQWANEVFKYVVNGLNSNKCVLYVDSWGGHSDAELYKIERKEVNVKVFPKCSTSFMQPLDLYCNRQWKDFAKRLTEHSMLLNFRLDQRNDVLKMQSLIYNQFQHTDFRAMFKCGWKMAGFDVPDVPFASLKEMLFDYNENCSSTNCENIFFIKCIHCKRPFCAKCFFIDYHFHEI
jgi:hypothetical protein